MTKILAIDDDQKLREDIVDILMLEGFDVIAASHGREGVQLAIEHLPDLILCDVMMPVMNGYEVIHELHNYKSTMHIPFIFLTAKSELQDIRQGLNLGAVDYMTKPFEIRELVHVIQTRLEQHAQMQADYQAQLETLHTNLLMSLPHELRTPLTGIVSVGQLLKFKAQQETYLESDYIANLSDIILSSSERLQRLIENYILFPQLYIQVPSLVDKQASVSYPSTMLSDIISGLVECTNRKDDVQVHTGKNIRIHISPEHLRKIIEELLSNAMKFSKEGTPIEVMCEQINDRYVIRFRDQGWGMSQQQINNIVPFNQFERQIHEQQGVGLGLVIVKKLVEAYEGEVTIESQLNQGTQVNLSVTHSIALF